MTDLVSRDLALPDDDDLALPLGAELDEAPIEGEIVEDAPPAPKVVVLNPVVQVFQSITIVVQHPHAKAAARHAGYVPAGAVVAYRRWQRKRSLSLEMGHQAKAQGDHQNALLWAKQAEEERHRRHERWQRRTDTAVALLKVSHWILLAVVVFLLLIGIMVAWARHNPADTVSPFEALAHAVSDAYALAAVLWLPVMLASPFAGVLALYGTGRRGGDLAPGWAVTSTDGDVDVTIDERAITQALAALRLREITDYLKTGMPIPYLVPCRTEGRGTYCEVRLPLGLPAAEIAKQARRERLAAGVYRHTKEVWPSVGGDASHLKLWIADKGALDEGAGPYPLIDGGFTDVFKGLPFGKTLRGDPARIPVIGRNSIVGGQPEQGKSNAARVIGVGYALDITTEMRIYVPDANFDFERFRPRCASYVMGAEDEYVERIFGELEELHEELQTRGRTLIDCQAEEVTRELAHSGIGLHPLWVLIEEAHVLIQHRQWGKQITKLLPEIVKLDRKRGVHVTVSTQAPTKDSMPRDVTRNCTVGIAYAVGDHVANDALLGQGAYKGGHRATELIAGTDRGTALCKGFAGEARSEMIQSHRMSGREGDDQVSPLIERAMRALAAKGRAVPGSGRPPLELAVEVHDLLDDLAEVIEGYDRVKLADLPPRLRKLAPTYLPYRQLDGVGLAKLLDAEGVAWVRPQNVPQLDPAELERARARREVS